MSGTAPPGPTEPTWRERPTGWRRRVMRAPVLAYRWHLGFLLGGRFVLVHHVGRRTGAARTVVVEVVQHDATGAVTVASGFGPGSDWYQNLLAHPRTVIEIGAQARHVRARALSPDEAAAVMADYAARHPRAARTLAGYMGFDVDPDPDFRAVGAALPMIRFEPAA